MEEKHRPKNLGPTVIIDASVFLRNGLVRIAGLFVRVLDMSLGQLHLFTTHSLVRNLAEKVTDEV